MCARARACVLKQLRLQSGPTLSFSLTIVDFFVLLKIKKIKRLVALGVRMFFVIKLSMKVWSRLCIYVVSLERGEEMVI